MTTALYDYVLSFHEVGLRYTKYPVRSSVVVRSVVVDVKRRHFVLKIGNPRIIAFRGKDNSDALVLSFKVSIHGESWQLDLWDPLMMT